MSPHVTNDQLPADNEECIVIKGFPPLELIIPLLKVPQPCRGPPLAADSKLSRK